MKLYPKKGNGGHITSYFANIGSKEARDAGFLNEDKTSKALKKPVDTKRHRIRIELDDAVEKEGKCNEGEKIWWSDLRLVCVIRKKEKTPRFSKIGGFGVVRPAGFEPTAFRVGV